MSGILSSLPIEMLAMFGIALLISAGGFRRFVYFVSLGFAFSIAAMAAVSLWIFRSTLDWLTALQCLLLLLYGLRLGIFLARREMKPGYRRELDDAQERASGITFGIQIMTWISVALLYVALFSPALFNLDFQRSTGTTPTPWLLSLGILIMAGGLALEALADHQKSAYKQEHPDRFCDVGLYRWVRCPNYLGEIIFWSGNFIAGIGAYNHWLRWIICAVALVCMILIMMGSTKRLESKQDGRYGELEAYQQYRASVPVLFPFIPLYSLQKARVYLE